MGNKLNSESVSTSSNSHLSNSSHFRSSAVPYNSFESSQQGHSSVETQSNTNADRAINSHHANPPLSMRVPRSGLQWLTYANQSDDFRNDSHFNTTRIMNRRRYQFGPRSLPQLFLQPNRDARCQMCNKMIPAEDIEVHFVMCLTKPRVTYNEDILSTTLDECAICLENLQEGEVIARLPCLCIYHKKCIDQWFCKSQTCPEHPPD